MSDLIARLRQNWCDGGHPIVEEAADRIAELEGLKRQLKITKARLFKAQAEFETMALHATTLEQANTRLTAHIKQIAAKHDVQRHDNYGNSYLVDLHETFCDFALSIFTKENHEATTD